MAKQPLHLTPRQAAAIADMAEAWDLDNAPALRSASAKGASVELPAHMVEHLGHALFLIRAMEV